MSGNQDPNMLSVNMVDVNSQIDEQIDNFDNNWERNKEPRKTERVMPNRKALSFIHRKGKDEKGA